MKKYEWGKINPYKTGIGEAIAIFWAINDPPGLKGLRMRMILLLMTEK